MGNELQEVGTQGENSARLSDKRQRDKTFCCEQPLALDPCLREESGGLRRVQSSVSIVPAAQETQPGPQGGVYGPGFATCSEGRPQLRCPARGRRVQRGEPHPLRDGRGRREGPGLEIVGEPEMPSGEPGHQKGEKGRVPSPPRYWVSSSNPMGMPPGVLSSR